METTHPGPGWVLHIWPSLNQDFFFPKRDALVHTGINLGMFYDLCSRENQTRRSWWSFLALCSCMSESRAEEGMSDEGSLASSSCSVALVLESSDVGIVHVSAFSPVCEICRRGRELLHPWAKRPNAAPCILGRGGQFKDSST